MSKQTLWIYGVLAVVAAGVVLVWLSPSSRVVRVINYGPVLPRVGDYATVNLLVLKKEVRDPANRRRSYEPSDYKVVPLRIECVEKKWRICRYNVNYFAGGKVGRLAYTVGINYSATNLDRRAIVRDPKGNIITRGQLIDGNPVPFRDFLTLDESWSDRTSYMANSVPCRVTRMNIDAQEHSWTVCVNTIQDRWHQKKIATQRWVEGEWIWKGCGGWDSGPVWSADRLSFTGTKQAPTVGR